MENVIFNGTKNRKPLQMAEVSLTFNNTKNLLPTEYSQVTISRRYYRSGESEYLLNNVTCRLKDITNLFLDTGIGPDSYAIIELGMVDDILNNRDNSRRGLFEEAAGVSKFKVRKKETLRKLETTAQDLERVEDLLFEITQNLKSLEKQAKQTENYFKLKQQYRELSVQLARKTVARQQVSVQQLKQHLEAEQERKTQFQARHAEKEAQAEKEKAALLIQEKTLSSRQKALNEQVALIRQYENEKNIKNERLRFLRDKLDSLQQQRQQDQQTVTELESALEKLGQERDKLASEVSDKQEAVGILEEETQSFRSQNQRLQLQVTQATQALKSRQETAFQLRKQLDIRHTQLDAFQQEMERSQFNTQSQHTDLQGFEEQLSLLEEKLKQTQQQVSQAQQHLSQTRLSQQELEEEMESLKHEMAHHNRQLDAKQNEYNLIKSLVDNLEGFPEAIKFLKQQVREMKGYPLLSDVLTCPEVYRVAIEHYLEPFMNYFIVDNRQQALQAVSLLNESGKGKAHFFVLEDFVPYQAQPQEDLPEAILALKVVEYDVRYEHLIAFLLEGVYLVAHDKDLSPQKPYTYLQENGKFTWRPYSLSGGSVGLFEGKRIGRARNLEQLAADIKSISTLLQGQAEELAACQSRKNQLRAKLSEAEKGLRQAQQEVQQLQQERVTVRTRQEQLQQLVSLQTLRKEEMQERLKSLRQELENLRPQAEQQEGILEHEETQLTQLNRQFQEAGEALALQSGEFNRQNGLFYQLKNKLTALEQEIQFKSQNLETAARRLAQNQEETQQVQQNLQTLLDSHEVQEDELVEMYKEKEAITQGVNEAEREYYHTRGEIDRLEKEARETHRQREQSDNLISEIQQKRNEALLNLTAVQERLSVEFNIDLNQLQLIDENQGNGQQELDEEELRQRVQLVKSQLDKVGPINPLALEAFQEMKERHDFIMAQKQDLTDARNSLIETITEIDQVARENFMSAFTKIREHFIRVFRSLFSEEDNCDLTLSDPDNPLEADIDIIAKPRGKRPLTINQLSGGEKTLTAISLLFAIYLIKPAPFCIFDEVDAPLDDANIDKFNTIIKKFSAESQFIIVTHNKRTMTSVDVIYGVSMMQQDYGVSRVVPVDLRELA
jgi:chromosome segregation protein